MTENATVNPAPAPVREWDQMAHTLFDREAATRQGHSYIKDQETVTRAAEGMTWHPAVEGMSMPFSPGMAIKTLVQALALREVSRVAYDGAVTTHDDYEGPGAYSLVGVETASEEGTWRIVVVDRGTDLVVAFTERQATRRPAWLVVATITIGATERVEADTEEQARALALAAFTADGTDPADVNILEAERRR
jgi:hypothetical protein